MYGDIVEIPSLFPDDTVMLGMLNLKPGKVERLWRDTCKACNRYFVWGIHPSAIAKDEERLAILERFLRFLRKDGADVVLISELANSIRKDI